GMHVSLATPRPPPRRPAQRPGHILLPALPPPAPRHRGPDANLGFDKTPATLETVARLNAWEVRNMVRTLGEAGFDDYPSLVLHGIASKLPEPAKQARQPWPEQLEETLRIKVTLLERNPGNR